ncbi:DUF1152 domain-containing protein [Candidatus Gracilibacteria bacterium]|nr:DUF1152 domain-containing protein [Candidatus Gracilibacteria bacterium]
MNEDLKGINSVEGTKNTTIKKVKTNFNGLISNLLISQNPVNLIEDIVKNYPEISWLTGDTASTPESGKPNSNLTIGEQIFPNIDKKNLIEFNRTVVGILVLQWILQDDYENFTACQKDNIKLSKESFIELKKYIQSILPDKGAIDAMIVYMVINDLTKIKSIVSEIQKKSKIEEIDHDKLLLVALRDHAEISPSFQRLSPKYQNLILNGLGAEFNIGQFIQGENVPANLSGLKGIDEDSLRFYLLHALCDIAGAAGQFVQNGSAVMTEPTYQGFKQSISALEKISDNENLESVYNDYLLQKSNGLELDINNPTERVITRICCMLRYSNPEQANIVKQVFENLPKNVQIILEMELNKNGINDGFTTLIYYSLALLANIEKSMNNNIQEALTLGLITLARIYQEARINLKNREGNGVYTVMASNIAKIANENPSDLLKNEIQLKSVGQDAEIDMKPFSTIDKEKFYQISNLSEIPGKIILPIGIGGGSDVIQSAQLAKLLKEVGKQIPAVVSVRTNKTGSQGINSKIGEDRTPKNAKQISDGVYLINSDTQMKGRSVEPIIADEIPTFLILIKEGIDLTSQIKIISQYLGGIDTIIGVDTGGDALYSSTGYDQSKATPDQDIQVLKAIDNLQDINTLSVEISIGVDTPENGEDILLKANAKYFEPNNTQSRSIIEQYKKWEMDGLNENRFGKTPLSWQKALKEEIGLQVIDLPTRVITDEKNPWKTFVNIQPSTKGMFFMTTDNHLKAIGIKPLIPYNFTQDGDMIKGPDFNKVARNGIIITPDGDFYEEEIGSNLLRKTIDL